MLSHVYIVGDSDTRLWGLGGRERLQRLLASFEQVELLEDLEAVPAEQSVLLLRGDCVFDQRAIAALLATAEGMVLETASGPVAARVPGRDAAAAAAVLDRGDGQLPGYPRRRPADLTAGYHADLKKNDAVLVRPIREEDRALLEKELFAGSYKGVTDLVTKWLWPLPARWATRACVRLGIRPNDVTLAGLVLAVLAGLAFWYGFLWTGLVLGWVMTFLDTLDGKLARVTVTASRLGNVLDHGLDIIHPPLWYLAWGVGVANHWLPVDHLAAWLWLMFAAYVGGRLCEGVFEFWLAPFTLFIWRPLDSFNRLITARRNPNLILMTVCLAAGRPDLGLYLLVGWHVLSTLLLAGRVVAAGRERFRGGELRSWLADVDPVADRGRLAVRVFTRRPPDAAARA